MNCVRKETEIYHEIYVQGIKNTNQKSRAVIKEYCNGYLKLQEAVQQILEIHKGE